MRLRTRPVARPNCMTILRKEFGNDRSHLLTKRKGQDSNFKKTKRLKLFFKKKNPQEVLPSENLKSRQNQILDNIKIKKSRQRSKFKRSKNLPMLRKKYDS